MIVAYLVNRYPAISHSFIRREIAGVEAAGVTVRRYSIRPGETHLPDARDRAETARTTVVLDRGIAALAGAALIALFTAPRALLRAGRLAAQMAAKAGHGRWRHAAYLVEAAWLVRAWRRAGVDHVHAHFGTNPAAVARIARALGGPPYSFTVHGPDEFDAPGALDLAGKVADAAFVAGISDYGRSQLMRWSDWRDWCRIGIVRCGLDRDFLDAAAVPLPDAHRLCFVGRLSAQKGLPVLVDAIAQIAPRFPALRVTIVGDGPLRAALEARAAASGITPHVDFVGAASNDAVRGHITDARALVVPSFAEGLPVVIMEALALRRPVIATAIAGIPELVDTGCGWLVPAGSAEALAAAMAEALDADPAALVRRGDVGHARVRAHHDASRNAAELVRLIEAGRT